MRGESIGSLTNNNNKRERKKNKKKTKRSETKENGWSRALNLKQHNYRPFSTLKTCFLYCKQGAHQERRELEALHQR